MSFGPLQVIPPGLIGFLQLKNQGQGPQNLDENLSPTMELFEWYMAAREEEFIGTNSIVIASGNTGFNAWNPAITVPDREMWWVRECCVSGPNLVAGEESWIQPAWRAMTPTNGVHLEGESIGLVSGTAVGRRANASARRFFVPQGSSLGVWVTANAATVTNQYLLNLRFVRLPL